MSASFTNDQLSRLVGELQQRVTELESLLDRVTEHMQRHEDQIAALEVLVIDLGNTGPSMN